MSLLSMLVAKPVFLVIATCSPEACNNTSDVESWVGIAPMTECREYITSGRFDPSDYLELTGDEDHYEISCSE
jgi:hypothetical protein